MRSWKSVTAFVLGDELVGNGDFYSVKVGLQERNSCYSKKGKSLRKLNLP